jgi:DNA-binding XRE family transcriptional regulator
MQAVVKTPRIEINIKGAAIPPKLIGVLREEYGDNLKLVKNDEESLVNAIETGWYKKTKAKMTPGDYLRIYRENNGLTQGRLGELLGGIPRQHISNMERGHRPISLKIARKLAKILNAPIEKLLIEENHHA